VTGKEAYAAMLRDVISPRLRAVGFTGSSGSYVWPSETHWIQVGFQKSRSGTVDDVKFTVNLTVMSKVDWELVRGSYSGSGARPAPTANYAEGWWDRLGKYTPRHGDKWWKVNARTDVATLGKEVSDLVATYGLPVLLDHAGSANPS
jgi:hypothetical protein